MKHHAPNYGPENCFSVAGQGREEDVLETSQLYKLEARQTAGALLCLEVTLPPRASVPPHSHELEDETFYVVRGSARFVGSGLQHPITLEAGGLFYSPRGHLHGLYNVGDTAALLFVTLTPGINIQEMFNELAVLPSRARTKWDEAITQLICDRFGVRIARSQQATASVGAKARWLAP